MSTATKDSTPAARSINLGKFYPTGPEIAEGFEATLDCGLPVRLARINSPDFLRHAAVAQKKFGGRDNKIPAAKTLQATLYVMARATFLSFDDRIIVTCDDEKIANTIEGRAAILETYPDIRDEIANLTAAADEDYLEALEGAGKD